MQAYCKARAQTFQKYLVKVKQSILIDHANVSVGCSSELTIWKIIGKTLGQWFDDNRTMHCFEQNVIMTCPNKNLTIKDFGKKTGNEKSFIPKNY